MKTALTISLAVAASPALALSPSECGRYVMTHAYERAQSDHGAGLVSWEWAWTAEGVADDLYVVDCLTGEALVARMRSERMRAPVPFDRRTRARAAAAQVIGARHFFSFDRLEAALDDANVPVTRASIAAEPCACAAFYPGAREWAEGFRLDAG